VKVAVPDLPEGLKLVPALGQVLSVLSVSVGLQLQVPLLLQVLAQRLLE